MQLLALKVRPVYRFRYFSFSGVLRQQQLITLSFASLAAKILFAIISAIIYTKRPSRVSTLGDLKVNDFVQRADD